LAAISVLTDALVQERFKRIVVDPVASAMTLRLLELPEMARTWLTTLLAVLVKYRAKGLGELADEAAALLKHVKRFEEAVVNPAEARFVVVTRGEELAAARTERLVEELQGRKLAVERVLVNRVLPKTDDPAGEERRRQELAVAKALEKKIGLPLTAVPCRTARAEVVPHGLVRADRHPGQDTSRLRPPWPVPPDSRWTSNGRSSIWKRRSTS